MTTTTRDPGGEAAAWWEAFVRHAPGAMGARLRRRYVARRAVGDGRGLFVGEGFHVTGWRNVTVGADDVFGRHLTIHAAEGTVSFGDRVRVNDGVLFGADHGSITIGDDVLIGMGVVIRAANHRFDRSPAVRIVDQGHVGDDIVVGDDVWLGARVVLLPGSRIGAHSVIGAGSVVESAIPACSVAAGMPARVIRSLERDEP